MPHTIVIIMVLLNILIPFDNQTYVIQTVLLAMKFNWFHHHNPVINLESYEDENCWTEDWIICSQKRNFCP